jgi:UDP-N-acetylglucosamine 2-epimerase (non-hydrolysing)
MKDKLPILLCFGTRPEWLKIKPLVKLMNEGEFKLLFTGQHTDLLDDLTVDHKIVISDYTTNRLDDIVSSCISGFPDEKFRGVLVQGDTASAFGCAIAGFHRGLRIYYLESGLRTYNLNHPYPEEGYRQMISRLSDVNFCPTELSKQNLLQEKVKGECHVVGNTVLDNLVEYKKGSYGDTVLVTLHRRENHLGMEQWFEELNKVAIKYPELKFILPIHPNPNVQKWKNILTNVQVIDPLNHDGFINTLRYSKFVISDSGGLQEEGSFFNKKVIVCRKTTERPEGIQSGHLYMCQTPFELEKIVDMVNENPYIESQCPYGDGYAANKILKILRNEEL